MSDGGYVGAVPEGRAAEEAEDLLAPPVVAARRRYTRMIKCREHQITDERACSKCSAHIFEIKAWLAFAAGD